MAGERAPLSGLSGSGKLVPGRTSRTVPPEETRTRQIVPLLQRGSRALGLVGSISFGRRRFAPVLGLAALACAGGEACAAEPLQYNRDIRPILAENCFACHGPDSAARQAGLRLDQRDPAIAAGAITPGKPDESAIDRTDHQHGPRPVMPPPETRKR